MEDSTGGKYDIKLEGNITKEKILKIYDMLNLINIENNEEANLDTLGGRIWNIIDKEFTTGEFTSSAILEKYEDTYNKPIKLSIISTYLARFTQKNTIKRTKTGREWTYSVVKLTH